MAELFSGQIFILANNNILLESSQKGKFAKFVGFLQITRYMHCQLVMYNKKHVSYSFDYTKHNSTGDQ